MQGCREKFFRDRENPFDCDDNVFFMRYRFNKSTAILIIDNLKEQLTRRTTRSKAFPPYLIVLVSLNILGSGNFQVVSGQILYHGLTQPGVSKIFNEFLSALIQKTKQFIVFPKSDAEILETKCGFFRKYGFPNVNGAIDGTHLAIQKPSVYDAYSFFNRKAFYSINVQAVCDSNSIFTDVVVRWPGSTHDSHIYKTSSLYNHLHSDAFPENTWLLGDSGYPLQHCLLTPVIMPSTPGEQNYNNFHKKTRKIVEQSFGILKSRFRIISKSGGHLCYNLEKCVKIILSCFILHNIARTQNQSNEFDSDDSSPPITDDESEEDDGNDEGEIHTSGVIEGRLTVIF